MDLKTPTEQAPPEIGAVSPENIVRLKDMMTDSVSIMSKAQEGGIECCVIFFDRNNIPATIRSGAHMTTAGILETISMLMMRAKISEAHQEKIREELAMWAMERVQGVSAAQDAASSLVSMEKAGISAPMIEIVKH